MKKFIHSGFRLTGLALLSVILAVAGLTSCGQHSKTDVSEGGTDGSSFVTIRDGKLMKGGEEFYPMGINLGNWLLLENFMVGMPGTYSQMIRVMDEVLGEKRADEFWKTYEVNYITEKDIAYIKGLGLNFIRVPFNQNRFVSQNNPEVIDPALWARLDSVISWCKKYNLSVLLDLHAVPGGQSLSNYADAETGDVLFWKVEAFRKSATWFWTKIADHFKNEPTVFGYGLLNESNTMGHTPILTAWLQETVHAIRTVDKKHIIVVSGEDWGKSMEGLDKALFDDPQVMPEIHFYSGFATFNHRLTEYPTTINGVKIDRSRMEYWVDSVTKPDYGRPVLLGEFGTGWDRPGKALNIKMMKDQIAVFKSHNIGWSIWTYKDIGAMGLMHPKKETAWQEFRGSDSARAVQRILREITRIDWRNTDSTGIIHQCLLKFRYCLPDDYIQAKASGINRRVDEVALRAFLEPIATYPDEKLHEMAASFNYNSCEVSPDAKAFMEWAVAFDK